MLQKYLEKIRKEKSNFKNLIQGYIEYNETANEHLIIYVNEKNPLHQMILDTLDDLSFEVSVIYI